MLSYGLIGEKLAHSLSPNIHNILFDLLGMQAKYDLFEVEKKNILKTVNKLKVLNIKGANVTIPYKEVIMETLDNISEEALNIGAINTINILDGKACGYNTDYFGFKLMLRKFNIDVKDSVAVVLGAGGASKAILQALLDEEAKVILVSRNKEEAKIKFKETKFISKIPVIDYKDLMNLDKGDIIINTTPCGMYPNIKSSAVSIEVLSKFKTAIDIIYNPEKTLFLKEAEEEGLKIVNGLYMLVAQAIKSEEIWNNIKIDEVIIDKIYDELKVSL
ncbi:shikimate dehydrogenase [Clostridium cavendishii DSM 21758]|uniref:Shikimate dehydrogenase (NADP(+)) n=1 Tax=Clostridium cavendishii DSM 21758 TaxID=1121302 RepID=A0A1M6MYD4_9CLOT|nr:shikimate dehydrogenase [Clostridium cavendishii]SHJ88343.1 shikimate dehydrogenase [Clostridium cavendishii DSM 21758]